MRLKGNADKTLVWRLSPADAKSVLSQLLNNQQATLMDGNHERILSLAGAKAVLLKMDEMQGRLDTPTALVKRGTKDLHDIVQPAPLPVIKAVILKQEAMSKRDKQTIIRAISAKISRQDYDGTCNDSEKLSLDGFELYSLNKDQWLLVYGCGTGAYNYTGIVWTAAKKAPYQPKLLEVSGEYDEKTGVITESMKGCGVGDCWSHTSRVYTGESFVLSEEQSDAMRRGFAGGAWSVPTFASKIVY